MYVYAPVSPRCPASLAFHRFTHPPFVHPIRLSHFTISPTDHFTESPSHHFTVHVPQMVRPLHHCLGTWPPMWNGELVTWFWWGIFAALTWMVKWRIGETKGGLRTKPLIGSDCRLKLRKLPVGLMVLGPPRRHIGTLPCFKVWNSWGLSIRVYELGGGAVVSCTVKVTGELCLINISSTRKPSFESLGCLEWN